MKRIKSGLALLLVLLLPLTALAEGNEPTSDTPEPEGSAPSVTDLSATTVVLQTETPETPAPVPGAALRIDSQNRYSGMERTYAEGYAPTVSGTTATIVLPLLCSGKLAGDSLIATPNLGSTSDSPFGFGNYQKVVPLSTQTVNDNQAKVEAYYIRFDLGLTEGRVNGVYPVVIDVQAFDTGGGEIREQYTTYVTITDGRSAPSQSSGGSGPTASKPVLMVTDCALSANTLREGDTVHVDVAVQNVGRRTAHNIRATIISDDPNILLLNTFSAQYARELKSGKDAAFAFDLQVMPRALGGMHTLSIQLGYEGSDNSAYTETAVFRVMVEQVSALTYDELRLPESVVSGESFSVPVSAYNPGQSAIYNVKFSLDVDGLIAASAYLGNLEPQASADKMVEVFATTLSGAEKYGTAHGIARITYEDALGQQHEEYMDLSIELQEPVKITDVEKEQQEQEAREQETLSQWWVSLLFGIAIIAVLISIIIVGKFSRMMRMR